MQKPFIIPLLLVVLLVVTVVMMGGDADRARELDAVYRNSGFSGATKELMIWLMAFGLGGFIFYLTLTRR